MRIDPWSMEQYENYGRLMEQFGIQEMKEKDWKDLPNPPHFFRRGIVFGHRDFGGIKKAILQEKSWALLTGLMPSGKMHLGHKMVIDQILYYQKVGAHIFIAVADIEAYATRGYTLKEAEKLAIEEYIANYIALGLKPCTIYFQSKNTDVKDLGYILGKKSNWSEMTAIYGFNGSTNMAHIFAPLIQCGDILHVQLKKYGGVRPTLVPVGIDQDPHLRFARDIASAHRLFNVTKAKDGRIGIFIKVDEDVKHLMDIAENEGKKYGHVLERNDAYKAIYLDGAVIIDDLDASLAKREQGRGAYGFILPSSTYHRFMTGLTGGKMSSSKPNSAIFLTDTPEIAKKKIQAAKTGGAVSLEEQKKHGGKPEECVIYELFLYHLIKEDKELEEIYSQCTSGKQMCGSCKKMAVQLMQTFLLDLHKRRKDAHEKIKGYVKM